MNTPLVIAGHGTRQNDGVEAAATLVAKVRELLPGVRVEAGFVELTPPSIDAALDAVLDESGAAVVVPLMIGTGGHVRDDIPEAIDTSKSRHPGATVVYTRHLGAPRALIGAVHDRIKAAAGEWDPAETTVIFVGRGCSVTEANAEHVRLSRVLWEQAGYAQVIPAFIQVAAPSLPTALSQAHATGARRIVVMPHFLFAGRLRSWVHQQTAAWSADQVDAPEVRVAEVIGPCDELATVVVQRYREGALRARASKGSDAYLTGLLLRERKVVIVGGGCVARRRLPKLVEAGAQVTVVAPTLHERAMPLVEAGSVTWLQRDWVPADLDDAWYVQAITDSPEVNAQIVAEAEARHTFCVRADDAELGSAWTPATGDSSGVTVAAVASRDPLRSRKLRDRFLQIIEEEGL